MSPCLSYRYAFSVAFGSVIYAMHLARQWCGIYIVLEKDPSIIQFTTDRDAKISLHSKYTHFVVNVHKSCHRLGVGVGMGALVRVYSEQNITRTTHFYRPIWLNLDKGVVGS